MHATLFPAFRSAVIRAKRSWYAALAACGVLALVTACGSSTAPNTTAAATVSSAPAATAGANRAAYVACLRAHGVAVPTAKPTASPASGHTGGAAIPAAARQACASLRPLGGHHKNAAVEAFDACMAAHGETIPAGQPGTATSAKPTGVARFLHGLNPDNAQVAAALKACESKLPATATATAANE